MIVNCPTCQTSYRVPASATATAIARCSKCSDAVPVSGRRSYRLLERGAGDPATALPSGSSFDWPDMPPAPAGTELLTEDLGGAIHEEVPEPTGQARSTEPEPAAPSRDADRPRGRRIGASLVAASVLAAAGAASGYYFSILEGLDSVVSASIGGGSGLLLSLGVIWWTRRKP